MINWFHRKKKKNKLIQVKQLNGGVDLLTNLQAFRQGVNSLVKEYLDSSDDIDNDVTRVSLILSESTNRTFDGWKMDEVIDTLSIDQLYQVQNLLEQDFKYRKH